MVHYDGSVRNAEGDIIQINYGCDSLDPTYMEGIIFFSYKSLDIFLVLNYLFFVCLSIFLFLCVLIFFVFL